MKIFIIESPDPNDILESRNEKSSLEDMCKMFGHRVASFTLFSKDDLGKKLNYISKTKIGNDDFLCIHISCHGNDDGLGIGADFIKWKELSSILDPLVTKAKFKNKIIIVISACGANEQKITKEFNFPKKSSAKKSPPIYIFVYDETRILWRNALLSWAILYHQLGKMKDLKKGAVKDILKRIKDSQFGNVMYFRWVEQKQSYRRFKP